MSGTPFDQRRAIESLDGAELERLQLERFNRLLATILPHNELYAAKLAAVDLPLQSLEQLSQLPFTFKTDLAGDGAGGGMASNRTWPLQRYVRWHQTSGTRGRPLIVLDTADDWQWWIDCWQFVLDAAEVEADDTAMLAFSFAPFIGFWSAFDAAAARGCLVIPGGGLNTLARLELMRTSNATLVFCTPSYALHMAEVAAEHQIDVAGLHVRRIIVAGEPGGSIPNVRDKIESTWAARVIDHAGASEIGPWGYSDPDQRGLIVNESQFIAEFLSVDTGKPAGQGELSELVLTSLGRAGCPVIRYRTGDLVRPTWKHNGVSRFVLLEGGLLGRSDDMMIIRGVNVYPSAVEQILRSFPEVVEYRMTAYRMAEMDQLRVEVEDRLNQPARVAEELRLRLGLKIEVVSVPVGSLPRFTGKGKRFVDDRHR